jgi:glycosyltransferase involved in cell wall biosynthesis
MYHFVDSSCGKWQISGVACVSIQILKKLSNIYKDSNIPFCYIPQSTHLPIQKSSNGTTLNIVYSGRIENSQKQIAKLTNSLCDAIESISNSSATLIGSGPDENLVVETIKQRNCSESVYFHGPVAHKNIFKFLKNFNVIILLSDYEGVPASIIEGMACGLVPVCLKCPGGIEELVIHNETGLLVENRGEDFINKLKSLQENPSLHRRLSLAAIEHVKKNYDVGVVAKKWEDFYNSFDNRSSFKRIRTPFWISLPKIKDEGFILSNYTELQFFIYQIRKRFKVGKRIRQFFQN